MRAQATVLRLKGYFLDGYPSSVTRLADNATVQGETALVAGDFADYVSGAYAVCFPSTRPAQVVRNRARMLSLEAKEAQ